MADAAVSETEKKTRNRKKQEFVLCRVEKLPDGSRQWTEVPKPTTLSSELKGRAGFKPAVAKALAAGENVEVYGGNRLEPIGVVEESAFLFQTSVEEVTVRNVKVEEVE